jgi:hypothetical protein
VFNSFNTIAVTSCTAQSNCFTEQGWGFHALCNEITLPSFNIFYAFESCLNCLQYTQTFTAAWPAGNSMRYLQHACWQPSPNVQSQITATWSAIYWLLAELFPTSHDVLKWRLGAREITHSRGLKWTCFSCLVRSSYNIGISKVRGTIQFVRIWSSWQFPRSQLITNIETTPQWQRKLEDTDPHPVGTLEKANERASCR